MITAELPQADRSEPQAIDKPWLFTGSRAAEMARLSHIRRKERAAELAANPPAIPETPITQPETTPAIDSPATRLERVQDELIERMTGNDDAKAVSALAQALKNVREVYHLVTGQAKPGVLKTDQSKRRQPAPQVAIEVDTEPVPPTSNPPTV